MTSPQPGNLWHSTLLHIYSRPPCPANLIMGNDQVLEGGPGGFSFNQYLIVDDEPLIFHTGPRKMFPLVREAVASVMPVAELRYVAFSHVEADECGSLNE